MEQTNTKQQANVDDSTNIAKCSKSAEDGNTTSADVPDQNGSTEGICEKSRKSVEADIEENEHSETEPRRNLSNVEDIKRLEEAMEEIQKKQKTHHLYCPNCTHTITHTAQLFEKGKETFPYNKEGFVLWFVVVFSFKYPFIYIPWLYNNNTPDDPEPPQIATSEKEEKHVPNWLRFLLVVVLLLLSAIVLLVVPSQPQAPPHIFGEPTSPSPPQFTFFPSVRFLSGISLLLLAIVALLWPSISKNKGTTQTNVITKVDGDEAPVPTKGSEEEVTTPHNEDEKVADSSTPDKKVSEPAVSSPTTPVKRIENLWKHIVVSVRKFLPTELDILKSIVYGGLIESITSLGVVSSAVGSGASTLNVLALGIANLFSGLSLIIYNLHVLIKDLPRFDGPNNDHMQMLAAKCYEKLLGNKDKVILHCIVVVVSFIFFGVIPPLSYGLSFKITNKGQYEQVLVVVAASLVCVISLSFAKAYAFGMGKRKTMAEYTGIAIGASGLSFITSQYVRDLLEKYNFHEIVSDYIKE